MAGAEPDGVIEVTDDIGRPIRLRVHVDDLGVAPAGDFPARAMAGKSPEIIRSQSRSCSVFVSFLHAPQWHEAVYSDCQDSGASEEREVCAMGILDKLI